MRPRDVERPHSFTSVWTLQPQILSQRLYLLDKSPRTHVPQLPTCVAIRFKCFFLFDDSATLLAPGSTHRRKNAETPVKLTFVENRFWAHCLPTAAPWRRALHPVQRLFNPSSCRPWRNLSLSCAIFPVVSPAPSSSHCCECVPPPDAIVGKHETPILNLDPEAGYVGRCTTVARKRSSGNPPPDTSVVIARFFSALCFLVKSNNQQWLQNK